MKRQLGAFKFLLIAGAWFCSIIVGATLTKPPAQFSIPQSKGLDFVNLLIGNGGDAPDGSGGMIPSTAPPFGMTRWVAQTQVNYVSAIPFNWTLDKVMGVTGTHQPAIWMGESGPISVSVGVGEDIVVDFEKRGLNVLRGDDGQKNEVVSVGYYNVLLDDAHGGSIMIEQTATSRVAHLRFTFNSTLSPYILFEVARPSVLTSTPTNISFPVGTVSLTSPLEVCGSSSERQDSIITPISIAPFAEHFKGYFCGRFDQDTPKASYGVIQNGTISFPYPQNTTTEGPLLSAFAKFPAPAFKSDQTIITLRIGTSFISEDQARSNIDHEIPTFVSNDESSAPSEQQLHLVPGTFENTAYRVRKSWTDILDRIEVEPWVNTNLTDSLAIVDLQSFWTAVVHTLQYPYEQHEQNRYYSGYDNTVHQLEQGGESYTGYSTWDTFRAEWAWQILFVPERIPGMVQSMLVDYQEGGWLPMWKNIVETSIMVGTHADSLIAEAVSKNITGFDLDLAWEAVWKDATMAPVDDLSTLYFDREENVDYEVRAGISSVVEKGWVANDIHSESASRTLDYAYDDYAAYVLALHLGKPQSITDFLYERAMRTPFLIYNNATGFMEARNADGSWAGPDKGWTEGDKWAYSFDVVHDIPRLIQFRGGNVKFIQSLDDHFDGGHNYHTNEPSHHIPYLYSLAGAAYKSQEKVREIARENYDNTPTGLSGNEDCGQMSAWYIFTAMGFYPVNPVSGEYVVGSPLFERISINLNNPHHHPTSTPPKRLTITAIGARSKPYVKSLTINGISITQPIIKHEQIANGAEVVFEMSDEVEKWGNDDGVLKAFGVRWPHNSHHNDHTTTTTTTTTNTITTTTTTTTTTTITTTPQHDHHLQPSKVDEGYFHIEL